MSISELFNTGSKHKWGDLIVNNLTVEGTLTNPNLPTQQIITRTYSLTGTISGSGSCTILKNGRATIIYIPQISGSTSSTSTIINVNIANLPSNFIPSFNLSTPVTTVYNNNTVTTGVLEFTSSGALTINVNIGGTLTSGQIAGTYGRTQFSYISE